MNKEKERNCLQTGCQHTNSETEDGGMTQHKNYDKDVHVSAGARDRKKLAVQAGNAVSKLRGEKSVREKYQMN